MRNGPNTLDTLKLPLESQVRVWCEKKGWKGPYMLLSIEGETCVFDMPRGPRKFCSTVVKPYLRKENDSFQDLSKDNENDSNTSDTTTTLRTASKEDSPIVMPQPNVTTRGRNSLEYQKISMTHVILNRTHAHLVVMRLNSKYLSRPRKN